MEKSLKENFKKFQKVHLVRYADDFIITGDTKELLENEVRPLIAEFLRERGLELSEEKTKISHIDDGFDFLGSGIRKYKGKLMTRPAKSSVASVREKIRGIVRRHRTAKTENLIYQLNPVIRGWAVHYKHVVSKKIFGSIGHAIWEMTWRWAKRRHPKSSLSQIKSKYFQREGNRRWVFREKGGKIALTKMSDIPIVRHAKTEADANPYDPEWEEYFREREQKKHRRNIRDRQSSLWLKQNGVCPVCQTAPDEEEERDIHHLIPKSEDGDDSTDNLALSNLPCHIGLHSERDLLPDASRRLINA
jgi:RNA-directed DNA polymerase